MAGRIVLLGATGMGIGERFVVPSGEVLSALDIQAQSVENLYSRTYLERPRRAPLVEALAALIACLGVLALGPRRRGYGGQAAVLLLAAGLCVASFVAFTGFRALLDPTFAIVAALAAYLVSLGVGIVEAQRQRRRSEQEREMALILAAAANRSKSNFLANMSHELRTPLNAILGFSEMMKTGMLGPISPPKYREYADDIHTMATHLLDLVGQILEMAKMESGNAQLSESEFDITDAVQECIRTARSTAPERGAKIVLDDTARLPRLWADRGMFMQMVSNLLSNGVKFTPSGGTIRMSGELSDLGDLRVSVSDTGIGMAKNEMASAFERFRAGDHAVAANSEGIGLGLPLTKAMIEMHGGRIEISSATGEGTRATLIFPGDRLRERQTVLASP